MKRTDCEVESPAGLTIGLTTEEGVEVEGSAGFKERKTDSSYCVADDVISHKCQKRDLFSFCCSC